MNVIFYNKNGNSKMAIENVDTEISVDVFSKIINGICDGNKYTFNTTDGAIPKNIPIIKMDMFLDN